jgi:hypothetical protein
MTGSGLLGTGLTFGSVAGKVLADLHLGRESPLAEIFSPSRFKPIAGGTDYLSENLNVARRFVADRFSGDTIESLDEVHNGEGRLVRYRGKQWAVYRDEQGAVHVLSPVCTHAGCRVQWNEFERHVGLPLPRRPVFGLGQAILRTTVEGPRAAGTRRPLEPVPNPLAANGAPACHISLTMPPRNIGRELWAIAEGFIPGSSTGPPPMESHETLCFLNASDTDANVTTDRLLLRPRAGRALCGVGAGAADVAPVAEQPVGSRTDPTRYRLRHARRIRRAGRGAALAARFAAGGECPAQHGGVSLLSARFPRAAAKVPPGGRREP